MNGSPFRARGPGRCLEASIRMTAYPPHPDSKGPFPLDQYNLSWFKQSYMFGSAHFTGLNVLMADASVRSTSYQVNADVWWYLGHRQDGQAIQFPD